MGVSDCETFYPVTHPNYIFQSPLMEKAYAKFHGDYASISGGFTSEAIEDLTGSVNHNNSRSPTDLLSFSVRGVTEPIYLNVCEISTFEWSLVNYSSYQRTLSTSKSFGALIFYVPTRIYCLAVSFLIPKASRFSPTTLMVSLLFIG